MSAITKALAAAALGTLAVSLAVPASAATFASFTMANTKDNLKWVKTTSTSGDVNSTLQSGATGVANVRFNFLDPTLGITNAKAKFTMTATSTMAAIGGGGLVGDPLDQPGITGSFTFTYNGPNYVDSHGHAHATGDVLLNGVFTLADITSNVGSSSASVLDSTATVGHSITYSSQFMSFAASVQRDFAFNITSAHPLIDALPGEALNSFFGSSGGSFSTVGGVPEPATWAVMMLGFGMLGLVARRRRALVAA